MAARRLLYLVSLLGSLVFYLFYRQWLSWLILLLVLGLPVFSLLVSLPGLLLPKVSLQYPACIPMGEPAKAWLRSRSPLPPVPLRYRLEVERTMTGEEWEYKRGAAQLPTDHCGQLTIDPERCRVYDYLGLFCFPLRKIAPGKVLVRPVPVPMEAPPDLSRYLARSWRPKRGGGFGENHELRLYRPGDSLQQIHWKLTAKTGKLILRETVEPERGLVLLKLDLSGTPEELDHKLGRLMWLSGHLLSLDVHHQICALTDTGIHTFPVTAEAELNTAVDTLLTMPCALSGTIRDRRTAASWEYYIGGGADEG